MTPAVFINSARVPFVDLIGSCFKRYETRTRNMLGRFLGQRVLIVETGRGKPLVRFSAEIDGVIVVRSRSAWEKYRQDACIPLGSEYDWHDGTKVKWLYRLRNVRPLGPFPLPDSCRRHGRTWAEFDGKISC